MIREYIERAAPEHRERLLAIYETIRTALPQAEERLSWGMPTFWRGYNLIHFAPAKHHIGLYPGAEAVDAFAEHLTPYKPSKGTIRLPNDQPLPLELIAEIARWADAQYGSNVKSARRRT